MKTPLINQMMRHLLSLTGICAVSALTVSTASAEKFFFGSANDRVSLEDAGFRMMGPATLETQLLPQAFRLSIIGEGFISHAFAREFPGIGGTNRNNFSAGLDLDLASIGGSNNRRFGFLLFGTRDLRRGGIFAGMAWDNSGRQIVLRRGHDSETLASEVIPGGGFRPGENMTLKVDATYSGNSVTLTLTAEADSGTHSVSATIDAIQFDGTLFGGGGRLRDGWDIDYRSFEIKQN
jgi:hypothetical protein